MAFTKGEWKVGKTPPLSNWVVGVNLGDPMEQNVIAQLFDNKADAQLIAAAPLYHQFAEQVIKLIGTAQESMRNDGVDEYYITMLDAIVGRAKAINAKSEGK